MPFDSNEDQNNSSAWNPFVPTKRDIERTEELASKNPVVAGSLGFLFPIGAMIYLNRGINNLKIFGYVFLIGFMIGMLGYNSSDKEVKVITKVIGVLGNVALMAENTRTITLARKRQSENNF